MSIATRYTEEDLRFLCRRSLFLVESSGGFSVRGHDALYDKLGLDPSSAIGDEALLVERVNTVAAAIANEMLSARRPR